ncbi:MAG TPA: PSD1 and planctomycete cytochrome C domain-containing protein [Urbifossiella sp.]|nr:PSD1 and planctomycete cytochrome C domain-containing protein [Urbifossiella sp.]
MARLSAILVVVAWCAPALADDAAFFEKSVRPVLVEKCLSCHSAAKAKSGLRLDIREMLLKGGEGGAAIVPGKPTESRLIAAVKQSGELKMPPAGKLPEREIAALEEWVRRGAPWPAMVVLAPPDGIAAAAAKHWAFQPIRRPPLPVAKSDNPIDRFIAAKLSDSGLSLSPRASKRTLIRRATFDLHGLPPTAEEIDAFLKDDASNAYEKLLDRLLASPRYGERWGRHWLDVARYADNKGYVFFEGKEYPWAWTYRDYTIAAFNRDLPFDRFIVEQLAADLVPLDDSKSLAALGFLTVGGHFMNNTHDIIDDRIDVVTRGLMGLTVTCARCHDHKFDPIPAADYYSLYGVFRSCVEPTVPPAWGPPPATGEYQLFAAELRVREKRLVDFVTAKHAGLVAGARRRAAEYLLAAHAARNAPPADDFMLLADPGDLNPSMIVRWRHFLNDAKKRNDPIWIPWHACAERNWSKPSPAAIPSSSNKWVREAFAVPPKSMKEVADRYGKLLADVDRQWKEASAAGAKQLANPDAEELRRVLYGPVAPADAPLALDWGFLSLFPDRATQGEYQKLIRAVEAWSAKGPPRAMVLADSPRPYDPRIFERGHPGRPGEAVPRQIPKIANPGRTPFRSGSGRLELARQIASKSNPLTARVLVNRVWMHHFGSPLVATPSDFGLRSDPPTHPRLLDWLAAEFMEPSDPDAKPWTVKRLHKLIMLSEAYRQRSVDREAGRAADSENRLLWRQNRRRLEFEALHDSLLAVSGSLKNELGGKPVPLPSANRRAVYGYVDRLEFPSLLTTFDVPNPAGLSPQRTATTVAPQALFLMNGPFARTAAKKLLALPDVQKKKNVDEKLETVFLRVLGRKPTADERKLARALLGKGPKAERWTDLVHGLLMTNEFAFVD